MSKSRIQQYMEKHRLTPLFEDLMNKVLNEQPDDPIVYIIKCLYKKAAIPIPKDLRTSPLRKSSPERIARRSKSPEKSATQAWGVASGPDLVDRSYEKPWLSHGKKVRSREEEKTEPKTKAGRKQKSGWVSDTKVTSTTFDDLFEEDHARPESQPVTRGHRKEDKTDITKAWAKRVSLEDSEDPNYRSRGYSGPRCHRNTEDPLAGEIMLAKDEQTTKTVANSSKPKGAKLEAEQHRRKLEKLLQDSDKASVDSGFDGDRNDDVQDDAIELLEDPEDLIREGVTNIPKSGYKLSRNLRHRRDETNVKLNINLFTGSRSPSSDYGNKYSGDYYESDLERPPTGMSYQSNKFSQFSPDASEDEFESVSQVVGPRPPVWSAPDSDGETHRQELTSKKSRQGKFSATAPVKFEEKSTPRRVDSENMFLDGNKTWAPGNSSKPPRQQARGMSPVNVRDSMRSLQSQDGGGPGGWNIPDDTEVSLATDWTEATSARKTDSGPKAY